MNKKIIASVAAILLLTVIVAIVFIVRGKDSKELDDTTNPVVDNSEMAGNLAPILGKDENDVKDTLDKPLTDKQQESIGNLLDSVTIPEGEIHINENGDMSYKTADGTIVEEEFRQDIVDKTEEEIEEDFDKIMEELQAQINNGGKPTGTNSQTTTTTTQSPTPGQTQNPGDFNTETGETSDMTDEDLKDWANRRHQAAIEQGYQGTDGSKRMDINDPNYADWVQGLVDSLEPAN